MINGRLGIICKAMSLLDGIQCFLIDARSRSDSEGDLMIPGNPFEVNRNGCGQVQSHIRQTAFDRIFQFGVDPNTTIGFDLSVSLYC